jgi:hypothetical protein
MEYQFNLFEKNLTGEKYTHVFSPDLVYILQQALYSSAN